MSINDVLSEFATEDLIFELKGRGVIVEAIDNARVTGAFEDRGRAELATEELVNKILVDREGSFHRLRSHADEYLDSVVASAIEEQDAWRARNAEKA